MDRRRGIGFAPNPISYPDVLAFKALHGVEMAPWELRALFALDEVRLAGKEGALEYNNGPTKPKSMIASLKALADDHKKRTPQSRNHRNG